MTSILQQGIPPWPADGLEFLGECPLCGEHARNLLHDGLQDRLFFTAPGSWDLFRCSGCGLAYLDPRPDARTIGRAYGSYFTHREQADDDPAAPAANWVQSVKQAAVRHYIARHFGAVAPGASTVLAPLIDLRPGLPHAIDTMMRHLPRPRANATLLDIGCGNGRFMAWARVAGWQCTGLDVDGVAVAKARERGFQVHMGELGALIAEARTYDAITISHVIEHVHDPRALLVAAARLLKPGGHFWIETPNLDAHGHATFGRHWRDLDPPRHLQIFHPRLLANMLEESGFCRVGPAPWQREWEEVARASRNLAIADGAIPPALPRDAAQVGRADIARREFITLTASVQPP